MTDPLDVSITQESDFLRRLNITVPSARVAAARRRQAARMRKTTRIKGFRKGKVPVRIIEERYGPLIDQRTVEALVEAGYREAATRHELRPVGDPAVSEVDYEPGERLAFRVDVEVVPTPELSRIGGFRVQGRKVEVTDEDVDAVIDTMRRRHAVLEPVERKPRPGDIVSVLIQPLTETDDGSPRHNRPDGSGDLPGGGDGLERGGDSPGGGDGLGGADGGGAPDGGASDGDAGDRSSEGGDGPDGSGDSPGHGGGTPDGGDDSPGGNGEEAKPYEFELGAGYAIPDVEEAICTLEPGTEDEFDVAYPDAAGELGATSRALRIRLNAVRVPDLPELTDDWVNDTTPYASVDELRTTLELQLREEREDDARAETGQRLLDQVIEANAFEVPPSLLSRYVDQTMEAFGKNEAEPDEETRKQLAPVVERRIKRDLVLDRLIEEHDLELSTEEFDQELSKLADASGESVVEVRRRFAKDGRLSSVRRRFAVRRALQLLIDRSDVT